MFRNLKKKKKNFKWEKKSIFFFFKLPQFVFVLYILRSPNVKGNIVRTNVYHKYIKDLKLNITIDLDGFIY